MTLSKPRDDASTWMSGTYKADKLKLKNAVVKEKISTLTETTIEFLSQKSGLKLHEFVGQIMTVHVKEDKDDTKGRMFTGTCISIEAMGMRDTGDHYVAQIRPWFWMLTRTRNTRVFQNLKVKEIVEQVMSKHGFADFEFKLSETYENREYTVQYRESDFDFISRLLEEEGIYYFFDHKAADLKNEKLIFADGLSAHKALNVKELKFKPRDESDGSSDQIISEWAAAHDVRGGKVSLTDYDFEKPAVRQMEVTSLKSGNHKHNKYEFYDNRGHYRGETGLGTTRTRVRMEAEAMGHILYRGAGDVRHFATGFLFKLEEHPEEKNNGEYLITEGTHYIRDAEEMKDNDKYFAIQPKGAKMPDEEDEKKDYAFTFGAVLKNTQYRAPLDTPWPEVPGIQIGEVVGPSGEEIYTDKYGRIRVRFRWDRENPDDDTASCWIRVVTQWSGNGYGLLSIPRIGQEVVVQFEDGDPDRPIVTGMMYNADKMPPYVDPDQPTRTGLMSRSSPGGGETDYNSLVMEDNAGKEYVHFQSQKDYQMVIKDRSEVIIGNPEANVDPENHTADEKSLKQTVRMHVTELVEEGNKSETVDKGTLDLIVEGDVTELVRTGNKSETIDTGTLDLIVEGNMTETVRTGNMATEVTTGNQTIDVKTGNQTTTVNLGNITIAASAGKIEMSAAQKIVLSVGGSSLEISQAGIKVTGTGTAEMSAPSATVSGSAMTTIRGGLVKIN